MPQKWDELWENSDKIKRWSIPDYHFTDYIMEVENNFNQLKALDMGCGIGRHSEYLAKKGFIVTAVDPSLTAINYLQQKSIDENFPVQIFQGDLTWLKSVEDNSFDLVVSWNVIYHNTLSELEDALKEFYRILVTGGKLLLTLNSTNNIHYGKGIEIERNTFINQKKLDGEHPHHYSDKDEVDRLLRNFKVLCLSEDEEEVGGKLFKDRWHWYIFAQK